MKSVIALATGAITLTAASPALAAKMTAEELQKKMVQNVYSTSEDSTYVMKLVGQGGEEATRKMRVFFKRDGEQNAKLLIKFQEPADIRGTALLSLVDSAKTDQWLYLPKMKKVRRIKGGNENEAFLGSDFTVGDLTSLDNDKERYTYTMSSENKKCGDTTCYVITGLPKAGVDASTLAYTKKVVEVRADNYMGSRVEFYAEGGKLAKVMELKGMHKDGASWVADAMEMKDLVANHSTVIEIQKRDTSKAPADSVFTQANLERN